jgi:hypothetical protein
MEPHNPSGKGGFKDNPQNINRDGRPAVIGIQLLREALQKKETEMGKTLFEHFIELAFQDKTVLIEAMKKLVPNAQTLDITGEMTLKEFFSVLRGEAPEATAEESNGGSNDNPESKEPNQTI